MGDIIDFTERKPTLSRAPELPARAPDSPACAHKRGQCPHALTG